MKSSTKPPFGSAWLHLFVRVYAVAVLAGGAELIWYMRTRFAEGMFFYQLFYVGFFLALGAVPLGLQSLAATALIRLLRLRSQPLAALVGLVTGAAVLAWAFRIQGSPLFAIGVVSGGAGAYLDGLAAPATPRERLTVYGGLWVVTVLLMHGLAQL